MKQMALSDRFKEAVRTGDIAVLNNLLADRPELVNAKLDDFPPLWLAVARGNEEVVRLLLSAGASVYQANRSDYRVLHKAAEYGRYSIRETPEGLRRPTEEELLQFNGIAQLLIRAGADINEVWESLTPLEIACRDAGAEMVRLLLKRGAKALPGTNHLLCKAALSRREPIEKITALLDAGILPVDDASACQPLITVAREMGDPLISCAISSRLIDAGASVNGMDDDGMTPLAWAVIHRNLPLAELLLLHGAKRNIKIRRECSKTGLAKGDTAYSIARKNHQEEVLLLMRKFRPEKKQPRLPVTTGMVMPYGWGALVPPAAERHNQ